MSIPTGSTAITDPNDPTKQASISSAGALKVDLATTIAGEDIANDRLKTSSEVVMSTTLTHNNVSVLNGSSGTTTNAAYSSQIDCSTYRTYTMAGNGASGNIQLLLQVSFDSGSTWFWHPNSITGTGNQFPVQSGVLTAPLCRVAAMNISGSTQNIKAWLCLGR